MRSSGAGAVIAPIPIARADAIRLPTSRWFALMVLVLGLAMWGKDLDRRNGVVLLCGYLVFVAAALLV